MNPSQAKMKRTDTISIAAVAASIEQKFAQFKETNNMTHTDTQTTEYQARTALRNDLAGQFNHHDDKLRSHFRISVDTPDTVENAVERIKAGKYTLADKNDRNSYGHWVHDIKWRAPGEDKDQVGYDAAFKKLRVAYRHAIQDVLCDPLEKAKSSVRRFETETFH